MARSGSYDFSINRDEIIQGALRQIGVLGESQTPSTTRVTQASQQLNLMIDEWEYMGVGLWLAKRLVLFPQADTVDYYIGPTGISSYASYCCLLSEYAKTEVATASDASDTTIEVDSDDDFTNGDYIGIETDNGDIHWTTINGVPAADVITITTGVDYAVSVDNHVYGFTNVVQRPLEIISAYRRDLSQTDPIDTMLELVSIDEYRSQTAKYSEGYPTMLAYEMLLDDIRIHLWPEPSDMKNIIHLLVKYPIQDFDASTDDWDFPRGWGNALKLNLALQLAPEYGRKVSQELLMNATAALERCMGADRELEGAVVRPDVSSYRMR